MITIDRFNNNFSDEWEKIVQHSNNGTLFHTRKFLSYHSKKRFIDHSFFIQESFYHIILRKGLLIIV